MKLKADTWSIKFCFKDEQQQWPSCGHPESALFLSELTKADIHLHTLIGMSSAIAEGSVFTLEFVLSGRFIV
jgi:hypothetical protein